MMRGLYAEDPEDKRITRDKICTTVKEFALHPTKGRMVILTVEQADTGSARRNWTIPHWEPVCAFFLFWCAG